MSIDQSYVLVVHNGEAWLPQKMEELLDDLSNQEERFELLIIDDGSEDETAQVAAQLASIYPQITFIRRGARGGSEAAVQLALRQAQGDRVVMVSSEDPANCPFRRIEVLGPWSNPVVSAPHFRISSSVTRDLTTS